MQIALVGDSILDNGKYVSPGKCVSSHLNRLMCDCNVVLLARDGSTVEDAINQIENIPAGSSHVIVSAGGNDALLAEKLLFTQCNSMMDALSTWADEKDRFRTRYTHLLKKLNKLKTDYCLCTIYEPPLSDPVARRIMLTILLFYNDIIMHMASERRKRVIDLRNVCIDPDHFANDIEPSDSCGLRIAASIAHAVDPEYQIDSRINRALKVCEVIDFSHISIIQRRLKISYINQNS